MFRLESIRENANKDPIVAILRDIMKHEDIQLVKAVKRDDGIYISQKLARDNVSDSLITRVKFDKETSELNIDNEVDKDSDYGFDDIWVVEEESEREHIG